jgi:PAS domain S-box-containing protein
MQRALDLRTNAGVAGLITSAYVTSRVTGLRPKWYLSGLYGFCILLVCTNMVYPLNGTVIRVERLVLPWNETLAVPVRTPPGWWLAPIYLMVMTVDLFTVIASRRLRRSDPAAAMMVMLAGAGGLAAGLVGLLADSLRVRVPYLGDLPYVLWVSLIGWVFVREYSATRDGLRASQERFRGIFDQTFQFIGLMTAEGTLLEANRTAVQFAGVDEKDVIGRPFWDTPWWSHSPELQQRLRNAVREAAAGKTVRFEATHPAADGTTSWIDFSLKPLFNSAGEVTLLIPEGRDITRMKTTLDALHASESRFRTLIQDLEIGVAVLNPDLTVQLANPAAELLLRVISDTTRGGSTVFTGLTDEEGRIRADHTLPWRTASENLTSVRGDVIGITQPEDQTTNWMVVSALVRLNQDGTLNHILVTGTDITSQRIAAEQRKALETHMAEMQKVESLGRLAGGIAHDFNNLLTVINGCTEQLAEQFDPEDPKRELAESVLDAGGRAASLTRQLLTYTRRQMVEPRPQDINEVIRDTEKLLRRIIGGNVTLETDLEEQVPWVNVDTGQMVQVLINLVINARDAMPSGGIVRLSTTVETVERDCEERESINRSTRYVVLTVQDQGVGIAEEHLPHVFEPLFTTKAPGVGTGLGLSTVKTVAEECGGMVRVSSAPGEGASFGVWLPEWESVMAVAVSRPRKNLPQQGADHLLVVEDEPQIRALLSSMLTSQGYSVTMAECGQAALDYLSSQDARYAMLITDVMLPDITGITVMERARALREGIPVLFLSGYSQESVCDIHDERIAFLGKPFTRTSLIEAVQRSLAQSVISGVVA